MDVRFGDVLDDHTRLGGLGHILLGVPVRVDDDGFLGSLAADQVACLGQFRLEESLDVHVSILRQLEIPDSRSQIPDSRFTSI